jgi:predicted transposase/invertase (TIGR01784 family)
MKQDSIIYQLFKRFPALIFDLLPTKPANTIGYRFEAVEVKEINFRFDGIFLPPTSQEDVYFCEAQQRLDPQLYERLLAEVSIYVRRERTNFANWRAIIIYPNRQQEQTDRRIVQEFLDSGRIVRIYLDELGSISTLPWALGVMVLTTLPEPQIVTEARSLLDRDATSLERSAIIELVTTVILYKFNTLNRSEVEAMLGIQLQDTRVYQEAKEEERRSIIEDLLTEKFGTLDPELTAIIPILLTMEKKECFRLLLNSSRVELLGIGQD